MKPSQLTQKALHGAQSINQIVWVCGIPQRPCANAKPSVPRAIGIGQSLLEVGLVLVWFLLLLLLLLLLLIYYLHLFKCILNVLDF